LKKPFVYITRKLESDIVEKLGNIAEVQMWDSIEKPVPYDILKEKASKAHALLTMVSDKVDESLIASAPYLKVIANLGVGYDNIAVHEATKRKILVCNTPDVLSDTTADLTFALLMATARRIVEGHEYIKKGHWQDWNPYLMAGYDIHHKTIGIVGMGRIGEKVAKRATGFEMNILYHNRSRKQKAEEELGAKYVSFEELLGQSDFVVSLAPLTPETKGMFNKKAFSLMKNSAIFINAGRGLVMNEADLYDALVNKEIAAAGLDVFEKEPISANHPLLKLQNVVVLPHIGSASLETRKKMMKLAVDNIDLALQGKEPKALVNREIWNEKKSQLHNKAF
jgi:glyoxylate reductase